MIKGFWRTEGKIPIGKEESRILYQIPPEGDYCAVLSDDYLIVDFDDFDHNSGELIEPVKGFPRSEAVIKFLDSHDIKYNGIKTEYGVHLEFKKPSSISKNKNNWYSALLVKEEIKVTKPVELIKVNGIERKFFKGFLGNSDIDELPPALLPLQKSKSKPFNLDFSLGNRNNALSAYALHLSGEGILSEDVKQIIKGINNYILEHPLDDSEIDLILRPETIQKMKQNEQVQHDKNINFVQVGNEIIDNFNIITVQGQKYQYKEGVYIPIDDSFISSYIRKKYPTIKTALKNETLDYISDITFKDMHNEEKNLVNVRNGLLKFDYAGNVELLPHNKETVSFRQFNALYNPNVISEILINTLDKFFDEDSELIVLFKQMLGYLLCNHTDFQKCFFFVGTPSSGKSKILNMITTFCGKENVSNLSLRELEDRFRAANIVGKTANINADLESVKMQSSGVFKSLVTGDGITLERKYSKAFSYTNTAKLIFASNQYPDFSKDSEGLFRRVICFPCNHVFKKTDADFNPYIEEDITSSEALSTLLNMAIEGYKLLYSNDGFLISKATNEASERFKMELNNIYQWIKENDVDSEYLLREPIKNDFTGSYMDYTSFCINAGEEPKPQKEFSRVICNEFGFTTKTRRVPNTEKRYQIFIKE